MLNIAEGSGRFSDADHKHFYIVARSSAFECAALTTVLMEEQELSSATGEEMKIALNNISKALFSMVKTLEKQTLKIPLPSFP